jgi:hypothetical protein
VPALGVGARIAVRGHDGQRRRQEACVTRVAVACALLALCTGCALGHCGAEPWAAQADGGQGADGGPGCTEPACYLPDLPEHAATGGASAGVLGDPATDPNAVGGPGATAMAGDYYLRNACARFVVQKPGRIFSAIPTGGNLIDADIVRAVGEPGDDEFGELTGFLNAMLYTVFDEHATAEVVNDGSDGKAAVVTVSGGRLDVVEYMNIPAILYDSGFGAAMEQAITTAEPWVASVQVMVRYALLPDECRLRVTHAFYDADELSGPTLSTSVGTFYQAAGEGAAFLPGFGFGPISATDAFVTPRYVSKVFGTTGRDVAYALRAYRYYDAAKEPSDLGASSQVTITGLTMTIFGEPAPLAALSPAARVTPFTLRPRSGGAMEYLVGVGRDLAAAQAAVGVGQANDTWVAGRLTGTVTPAPAARDRVRVAVFQDYDPLGADSVAARKVLSSFTVWEDGSYGGELPVGTHVLELDAPGHPRTHQKVTVREGETVTVDPFAVPQTATLEYHVTAGGAPTACRIAVIGQVGDKVTGIRSNQYRDTLDDKYDNGIAYVEVTSVCDSAATGPGTVGPLKVVPGRYRVVISHGPEFSIVDRRPPFPDPLATAGGTATVTGDLKRRIGSDGWAAVDLHVHGYYSFDSRLPHEQRLTSYLAEAVDFLGFSEHDVIFDLSSLVTAMGYETRIATMAGTEMSPMFYGHFNAFEPARDPANPVNFGAPDWSRNPDYSSTTVVTPDILLGMARSAGADFISANHPRAYDSMTFLSWWDRCGLQITFGAPDLAHAVGCDWGLAVVPAEKQDVDPGATLWTDKFDVIEIYNRPTPICRRARNVVACREGQAPEPCVDPATDPAGRIFDAQVDLIMQDWFNMLQVGFIRSIIGNSDSHTIAYQVAGMPRTYVYVGSGQDQATNPQLKALVKAALKPAPSGSPVRLAAAAVAGNGPLLKVSAAGAKGGSPTSATLGGLLQHDQAEVTVTIRVEAPEWLDVDRLEVFVNQGRDIYDPQTLRPGDRNNATLVAPLLQTDTDLVVTIAPGDWLMDGDVRYFETTLGVPVPSASDSWIVVKASGSRPMYPVLPDLACFAAGSDPADADPFFGTVASAIANPIFVDRDGVTGWHGPAAP